jgi:helicase required for RNAi-mediated heterochromatin assembly 1
MSRNLLLDANRQVPANPPLQSGSPDKWHAYINGGAQADDARALQKQREENAAFEVARRNGTPQSAAAPGTTGTLIETSPRKPNSSVSNNTNLLVDLDVRTGSGAYQPQQARSYASAAKSETTPMGSEYSLLD